MRPYPLFTFNGVCLKLDLMQCGAKMNRVGFIVVLSESNVGCGCQASSASSLAWDCIATGSRPTQCH